MAITCATTSAGTHVGIVTAPDTTAYRLLRGSAETPLAKGEKLFPGDVVKKTAEAQAPDMIWWPYANWKDAAAPEQLEVAFTPPDGQNRKGFLHNVKSFLGFVETEYASVHGVADQVTEIRREDVEPLSLEENKRDQSSESVPPTAPGPGMAPAENFQQGETKDKELQNSGASMKPRPETEKPATEKIRKPLKSRKSSREFVWPGLDVTLLPDVPVEFRGAGSRDRKHRLVVQKSNGKEVFTREFTDRLAVKPEQIGLPKTETWTWKLAENTAVPARLRMLSDSFVTILKADLVALKTETPDLIEQKIQTAAYLQMLSDTYPQEVSLYWLSLQTLEELKIPSNRLNLLALREQLLNRAITHFENEQSPP